MKKIFCFLSFFTLLVFGSYAQEDESKVPLHTALNVGAGLSYTNNPSLFGGHLEFGINLYKDVFFVGPKLLLRIGGFEAESLDNTVLTLSGKVVFGRADDGYANVYVYAEGGSGFYGNTQKSFSRDTLVYNFGFGGGFDFCGFDFGGLYVEVGYLGQKLISDFFQSGILVQTGWRFFLWK